MLLLKQNYHGRTKQTTVHCFHARVVTAAFRLSVPPDAAAIIFGGHYCP